VTVSDLYAMGFDPVAKAADITDKKAGEYVQYMLEQQRATKAGTIADDIKAEFAKVREADLLIFFSPIWWFSVPAMLKGWFDRVFATGYSWDFGAIYDKGLLRGKKALMVAVPGGPEAFYQHEGFHRATLKEVLHPILWGTLHFCGLDVLEPFVVHSPFQLGPDERKARLGQLRSLLSKVEEIPVLYRHAPGAEKGSAA
jgi:NAD(P)H dehydrogenase (quinone)